MGFKLSVLCLALLAVAVAASSICKCGPEEKIFRDSADDSVTKYKLKMKTEDGKEYDEEVKIDTKKETETFHVPKTSPDEEEADIVFDFKKNLMMIRMPEAKSCFLSKSTENTPKPADLVQLLDSGKDDASVAKSRTEEKFVSAGMVNDRSILNDEMAELCAKLPIYLVAKVDKAPTDGLNQPINQAPAKRTKRCTYKSCWYHRNTCCWWVWFVRKCRTHYTYRCEWYRC